MSLFSTTYVCLFYVNHDSVLENKEEINCTDFFLEIIGDVCSNQPFSLEFIIILH